MPKFKAGASGNPHGRPKGALNKATRDIRAFARAMLEDPAYIESLRKRMARGTAGQVENLIYHYAYGKPRETLELTTGAAPLRILTDAAGDERDRG